MDNYHNFITAEPPTERRQTTGSHDTTPMSSSQKRVPLFAKLRRTFNCQMIVTGRVTLTCASHLETRFLGKPQPNQNFCLTSGSK